MDWIGVQTKENRLSEDLLKRKERKKRIFREYSIDRKEKENKIENGKWSPLISEREREREDDIWGRAVREKIERER